MDIIKGFFLYLESENIPHFICSMQRSNKLLTYLATIYMHNKQSVASTHLSPESGEFQIKNIPFEIDQFSQGRSANPSWGLGVGFNIGSGGNYWRNWSHVSEEGRIPRWWEEGWGVPSTGYSSSGTSSMVSLCPNLTANKWATSAQRCHVCCVGRTQGSLAGLTWCWVAWV